MYDYSGYGYDYGYTQTATTGLALAGGILLVFWLIGMAISIFSIVCLWKVFNKAGKPGWASLIPIYNMIVMIEISGLPMWYIALFFIPFANIYAMFKIYIEIAHKFGKSTGFGVGMVFFAPIFFAILAFDKKAVYLSGVQTVNQATPVQPTYTQPNTQPMYSQPVQPAVAPVTPVVPVQETPVAEQPFNPTVDQVAPTQPQTPAFCTNCGSPLMPGAKFCTHCGKQL